MSSAYVDALRFIALPQRNPVSHRNPIRTGGRFDAVIDFDRAARDPHNPRALHPSLDVGDHLHLNPAGYRALADAVPARLFRPSPLPAGFGYN